MIAEPDGQIAEPDDPTTEPEPKPEPKPEPEPEPGPEPEPEPQRKHKETHGNQQWNQQGTEAMDQTGRGDGSNHPPRTTQGNTKKHKETSKGTSKEPARNRGHGSDRPGAMDQTTRPGITQ